jgi:hypothetical protein
MPLLAILALLLAPILASTPSQAQSPSELSIRGAAALLTFNCPTSQKEQPNKTRKR